MGFGLVQAFWLNKNVPRVNAVKFRIPWVWSVVGWLISRTMVRGFGAKAHRAIVVGLVDVDSVTIAMARLPSGILSLEGAAYAILAAVAGDTVSKVAIGAVIGRGRFAAQIGIMATICLSVAAAVLGLTLVLPGMRGLLSSGERLIVHRSERVRRVLRDDTNVGNGTLVDYRFPA